MRHPTLFLLPAFLVGLIVASLALTPAASEEPAPQAVETIREKLQSLRPDLPIEAISAAPISGYYAVELAGGSILYASADAGHLFAGDLFELAESELVNLSEQRRERQRGALIEDIEAAETVAFSPASERRAVIYVFTDIDCGYCRRLHRDMARLNELGIEVRYLAYPRSGPGTASYDKAVTAWCSEDRQDAMTRLKAGERLPQEECANPVADHYELGNRVGVAGTPAILTEEGRMIPGYMPPEELAARIGLAR